MIHFRNFLFSAVCAIGGAILLVSGGLSSNDSYVVSRHVASPAVCQEIVHEIETTDFGRRFHFPVHAGCLMEIEAVKGDKLNVDR